MAGPIRDTVIGFLQYALVRNVDKLRNQSIHRNQYERWLSLTLRLVWKGEVEHTSHIFTSTLNVYAEFYSSTSASHCSDNLSWFIMVVSLFSFPFLRGNGMRRNRCKKLPHVVARPSCVETVVCCVPFYHRSCFLICTMVHSNLDVCLRSTNASRPMPSERPKAPGDCRFVI